MLATKGSIFHAKEVGVCSADDGQVVLNLRFQYFTFGGYVKNI